METRMKNRNASHINRFLTLACIVALLLPALPAQQQGATQQGAPQQNQTPPAAQKKDTGVIDIHQLPPPPPADATTAGKKGVKVYTDLVQIDATVVDKDGNIIKGLTKENFQIQEEGKPQTATALDYFDVERIETAEKADAEPITIDLKTANDPEKLRPIVREHRMIVLFFDLTSMAPEDLLRSTNAAMKFLKEQMTPADLIAVVSF